MHSGRFSGHADTLARNGTSGRMSPAKYVRTLWNGPPAHARTTTTTTTDGPSRAPRRDRNLGTRTPGQVAGGVWRGAFWDSLMAAERALDRRMENRWPIRDASAAASAARMRRVLFTSRSRSRILRVGRRRARENFHETG